MSRAEGKSKKTSQSKRGAFANDVVLSIKTPTEDRLSGVPLAFALCRNMHAEACMLEANNRREIDSFGVRALPKHTRGSAYVGGKQPARISQLLKQLTYTLKKHIILL